MKVIFYNRDFSSQIPLSHLRITVERYSHSMNGGPDTAYLKIETSNENWELTKLLRAPVEIYDGDGHLNWWGYVNRVNIPSGDIMVGLGLDNMSNYVAANYSLMDAGATAATSQVVTAWASDVASIQEYGQKEKLLTLTNVTAAQATSSRDTFLASNKYAPPEVELSGGNVQYVRVECYGWFRTLEWKYYSNNETVNTATTTQISAIVTSAGQFFNGSLIENVSGIDSNQYRDGTANALRQVLELMNAGTTNDRPLLARVDKDRYLHIYERQIENPEYLMRSDGQLETLLGQIVKPSHCINAAWVRIKDIPDTLGGLSAMRNFFLESAEYNAEQDRTVYRPAGAFEPLRLKKWLGLEVSSNVGSSGGGSSSGGFDIPYHVHSPRAPNRVVRTEMDYTSIASASQSDLKYTNASLSENTIGAQFSSTSFTLPRTGYYFIAVAIEFQDINNLEDANIDSQCYTDNGTISLYWNLQWTHSTGNGGVTAQQLCFYSGIIDYAIPDNVYIDAFQSNSGSIACDVRILNLSIIEL